MTKPPTVVDLTWTHDLAFTATSGTQTITLDGNSQDGPSPVQTMAMSLAGCMAIDVAHMLTKGRAPFRTLRAHLVADRAQENPHRFLRATLTFIIEGDVARDVVERAVSLAREKYCSVWHSMRQDIEFTTTVDIKP